MKNASKIAMEFNAMLPAAECPEHTEGREGFYHLCGMQGDESGAVLQYILRDHERGQTGDQGGHDAGRRSLPEPEGPARAPCASP